MVSIFHSIRARAASGALFLLLASSAFGQSEGSGSPVKDVGDAVKGIFGFIGRAVDTLTDQKATELRGLVEAGKHDEAAAFYLSNEKDFASSDIAKGLLPKIAEGLNARLAAGAEQSAERLATIQAPLPASEWTGAKTQFADAGRILAAYNSQALLSREAFRSPAIGRLAESLTGAERRLAQAASQAFGAYNHAGAPLFYPEYPVSIDSGERTRIVQEQVEAWMPAVAGSTEVKARALIGAYAAAVQSDDHRTRLARAYAGAYLREKGWSEPLTMIQLLQQDRAVQDVLPGVRTQSAKIAIVTVIDAAGTQWKAAQWDAHKTGLTPLQTTQFELTRLLQDLVRKQAYASVLVAVPTPVKSIEVLRGMGTQSSRRITGKRQVPNPEYAAAQQELQKKQQEFSELEQKNEELQRSAKELASQSNGGLGGLGAILGGGLGTYALATGRQEMEAARRKAQTTPSMVERQVFETYSYPVARMERIVSQQVALYIVDGTRFKRTVLNRSEKREATIAYHVDARDPNKPAIEQRNAQGRAQLRQLDTIDTVITPEQALQAVIEGAGTGPAQPMSALAGAVRDDDRKYQADAAAEAAGAKETTEKVEQQIAQAAPAPIAPTQVAVAASGDGGSGAPSVNPAVACNNSYKTCSTACGVGGALGALISGSRMDNAASLQCINECGSKQQQCLTGAAPAPGLAAVPGASGSFSASGAAGRTFSTISVSVLDGVGAPSQFNCMKTEWISETVPTSNNVGEAYFSSKGPRDSTGRDPHLERKLLLATYVCEPDVIYFVATCHDKTMLSAGGGNQQWKERWTVGELSGVWATIATGRQMKKGQQLVLAESYVFRSSYSLPNHSTVNPVQVAMGVWQVDSLFLKGTSDRTEAKKKLDRRHGAMHLELNRILRGTANTYNLTFISGNSPATFRKDSPGSKSCKTANIQAVWDSTQ